MSACSSAQYSAMKCHSPVMSSVVTPGRSISPVVVVVGCTTTVENAKSSTH